MESNTPFIVGIRFQKIGKVYHFDASRDPELKVGDHAIVETSRGRQLGQVVQIVESPTPPPEGTWKSIQRRATPRDLVLRQLWQKKELEAMINCRAKAAEIKYPGVKIVAAEFSFDGSRLAFLYSTENENRMELRQLRDAMQRLYPRTRVETRQIGPRDVAKYLGGLGACGLENRCCSMFLTDFSPISIKMAKEQGISLTPTEITGMCGRLRCCLVYEYEQYVEARKTLPKRNKVVVTPQGNGKVIDHYPMKQTVVVYLESGGRAEFRSDELEPWDELEALRRKAAGPCDRHENGGCTCGKDGGGKAAVAQAAQLDQELGEAGFFDDIAEPLEILRQPPVDDRPAPAREGGRSERGQRNRDRRQPPSRAPKQEASPGAADSAPRSEDSSQRQGRRRPGGSRPGGASANKGKPPAKGSPAGQADAGQRPQSGAGTGQPGGSGQPGQKSDRSRRRPRRPNQS